MNEPSWPKFKCDVCASVFDEYGKWISHMDGHQRKREVIKTWAGMEWLYYPTKDVPKPPTPKDQSSCN